MTSWQGEERRASCADHDLLIKIDTNLTNFMGRFERHEEFDNTRFERLFRVSNWNQKVVWVILGAVAFAEFIFPHFGEWFK